jgi:F-type H+-transporting ATPase subunit delta
MTNRTAALRYARALIDVALHERTDLNQIERDLAGFTLLFEQHPELARVMLNPAVPVPRKRAAIAELLALAHPAPIVAKLVALLADRDRLVLLPDLLAAYRDRVLDYQKIVRAEITTAAALPPDKTAAIERTLADRTGRTVLLSTRVDPSLIGGLVARIGSTVYDGSVARQLAKMRERLAENV